NAILANPVMIKAYKAGLPSNGKPFPDGCLTAKIEWKKKQNPVSPYSVDVPDTLKRISLIEKDSKRFPNSSVSEYAQFLYDTDSAGQLMPLANVSSVGHPASGSVSDGMAATAGDATRAGAGICSLAKRTR